MKILMRVMCFFVGHGGPVFHVTLSDGTTGRACGLCDAFIPDEPRKKT